jgi:nanoRNase/pAp phosphatase (c-di-AMP/oligoRNAs hydrolase)
MDAQDSQKPNGKNGKNGKKRRKPEKRKPTNKAKTTKTATNHYSKFGGIAEKVKGKKAALFSHRCPDPDAIGSMMGMIWLLEKAYDIEAHIFYTGAISHPQNKAMCNLLDPNMRCLDGDDPEKYKASDYALNIMLDNPPQNAGVVEPIDFDIVIDHHHTSQPEGFKGLYINLGNGSCCAIVYDLIKQHKLNFEVDSDYDSKVATAMLVGIATDTDNMLSDDSTEYEFRAYMDLFEYRNPTVLKQIIKFKRPKYWIDLKAEASKNFINENGIAIVGIGSIPKIHRDFIADMVDEMITWSSVDTAICFAIVDGDRIEGCVRSIDASMIVDNLASKLGGKYGSGGGKQGKGAYSTPLAGMSIEEDEDEETISVMWEAINKKETKRILKLIKK